MTTEPGGAVRSGDPVDHREPGWYVTIAVARPPVIETAAHPTAIVARSGDDDMEYEPVPKLVAVTAYSGVVDPVEAVQHVCQAMLAGDLPRVPPAGEIKAIASDMPPWCADEGQE